MARGSTLHAPQTLYRSIPVSVRGIDAAKREATFVASTENPVDTLWGREVLRMGGVDLTRFEGGGPFLDAHDGSSIDNVLGSGEARVVGRELEFVARFDTESKGARAWGLVERGHVRTVSIGYRIDPASVLRLKEGQSDGEGEAQVRGPANVVRRWELLEVSLVPVPADRDAKLRAAGNPYDPEANVAEKNQAPSAPPSPLPAPSPRAVAPEAPSPRAVAPEAEEVRARAIRAIAPASLSDLAYRLVLEGKTLEEARAALLAAHAARSKPQGTPEAPLAAPGSRQPTPKSLPAEVTDEVLARALRGNF